MKIESLSKNLSKMTNGFAAPDCGPFVAVIGEASVAKAFLVSNAYPKRHFVLAEAADKKQWLLEIPHGSAPAEFFFSDDEKLEVEAGTIFISNLIATGVQEIL